MKAILGRPDGSFVTVLQNFLLEFLASDNAAQGTQKAVDLGRLIFNPITYYIRYVITGQGAGKVKILSENTQKAVGITNFNLGQLPKFTNFAWNRIGIRYVDDAATPASIKDAVGWTNVVGSIDKSVANGELLINKNGSPVFENPIAPFLFQAAPTAGTLLETSAELDQIRVFRENELVSIEVNLSNVVPSVANHVYGIEVALHGLECKLGAN